MFKSFILITSLVFSNYIFAYDSDIISKQSHFTKVSMISAGPFWQNGGKTQTINFIPEIEKKYVYTKATKRLVVGEMFLGRQKRLSRYMQGQLGLAFTATGNARLYGVIWDEGQEEFNNYNFSYSVQHNELDVKARLLLPIKELLTTWVSGSVGLSINTAYSFKSIPTIYEAVPTPNFYSNTSTTLGYTFGAGVQISLNLHWQFGCGYQFSNWGKNRLDHAPGQLEGSGLFLRNLYTQGVLLNLTHLS